MVENLHHMLDSYNSSNPIWFGAKYTFNDAPKIYMSGGSGYVLSKAALEMYVKVKLFPTNLYLPGASFFLLLLNAIVITWFINFWLKLYNILLQFLDDSMHMIYRIQILINYWKT